MDKFIINSLGFCCILTLIVCTLKYYIITLNSKKEKNKVNFYVARDKNGELWLYIGKPKRYRSTFGSPLSSLFALPCYTFNYLGLNKKDYDNIKWEDEPVEVFLNMKD